MTTILDQSAHDLIAEPDRSRLNRLLTACVAASDATYVGLLDVFMNGTVQRPDATARQLLHDSGVRLLEDKVLGELKVLEVAESQVKMLDSGQRVAERALAVVAGNPPKVTPEEAASFLVEPRRTARWIEMKKLSPGYSDYDGFNRFCVADKEYAAACRDLVGEMRLRLVGPKAEQQTREHQQELAHLAREPRPASERIKALEAAGGAARKQLDAAWGETKQLETTSALASASGNYTLRALELLQGRGEDLDNEKFRGAVKELEAADAAAGRRHGPLIPVKIG